MHKQTSASAKSRGNAGKRHREAGGSPESKPPAAFLLGRPPQLPMGHPGGWAWGSADAVPARDNVHVRCLQERFVKPALCTTVQIASVPADLLFGAVSSDFINLYIFSARKMLNSDAYWRLRVPEEEMSELLGARGLPWVPQTVTLLTTKKAMAEDPDGLEVPQRVSEQAGKGSPSRPPPPSFALTAPSQPTSPADVSQGAWTAGLPCRRAWTDGGRAAGSILMQGPWG